MQAKRNPKERQYIALADDETFDFSWTNSEITQLKYLYNAGYKINQIALKMHRDPDEVAVVIIALGRKNKIKRKCDDSVSN